MKTFYAFLFCIIFLVKVHEVTSDAWPGTLCCLLFCDVCCANPLCIGGRRKRSSHLVFGGKSCKNTICRLDEVCIEKCDGSDCRPRREVQNTVQYVGVKTVSTAVFQLDKETTLRYAALGTETLQDIRHAAMGNTKATQRAMSRAKQLRFPKIMSTSKLQMQSFAMYYKTIAAECPGFDGDASFLRYADELGMGVTRCDFVFS